MDGFTILLTAVVVAALVWYLDPAPPRYRCGDCGYHAASFDDLVAHDSAHAQRREDGCWCGLGAHHPSCPLRTPRTEATR